jgi:hypothetical protein
MVGGGVGVVEDFLPFGVGVGQPDAAYVAEVGHAREPVGEDRRRAGRYLGQPHGAGSGQGGLDSEVESSVSGEQGSDAGRRVGHGGLLSVAAWGCLTGDYARRTRYPGGKYFRRVTRAGSATPRAPAPAARETRRPPEPAATPARTDARAATATPRRLGVGAGDRLADLLRPVRRERPPGTGRGAEPQPAVVEAADRQDQLGGLVTASSGGHRL